MSRGLHPQPSILFAHGERYGKLTVLNRAKMKAHRGPEYRVGCECGYRFVARGADLKKGRVKECFRCAKVSANRHIAISIT